MCPDPFSGELDAIVRAAEDQDSVTFSVQADPAGWQAMRAGMRLKSRSDLDPRALHS